MESAAALIDALGGSDNILDVEPCSMRLRIQVGDQSKVHEAGLRIREVLAVVRSGDVVQIITGRNTDSLARDISAIVGEGTRTPLGRR